MKKHLLGLLLAGCMVFALSACTNGPAEEEKPTPVNYKEEYRVEDIVKTDDMIFDTEELFAEEVTFEEVPGTVPSDAKYSGIQGGFYNGVLHGGKESKVFAYFGMPATETPEGGFPAVVLVHGAGGMAYYDWVQKWIERGYAAISIDIGGRMAVAPGQVQNNPDGGPEPYNMARDTSVEYTESWIYFSVCSIIHANNFMRSQENVDADNIGCIGLSWGSILSLIVSGVDKRFEAFTHIYGNGFIADEGWGQTDVGLATLPAEQLEVFNRYYDPKNYVPYATKPALFTAGTDDPAFSMLNRKRTSDLVKGKTFFSLKRNMEHYNEKGFDLGEVFAFMDHILKNEPLSARLDGETIVADGFAYFDFKQDSASIYQIRMVYTQSDVMTVLDSRQWEWNRRSVDLASGRNYAVELPSGTTAVFFEITDGKGYQFSTDMIYTNGTPVI